MSPAPAADPELVRAQDPRTPMGRLMVLAGTRPDLRPVIATNAGCSPDLRAWIARLGAADDVRASSRAGTTGADGPADVDSLAPFGWTPSDPWLDENPFGSVLGDPLMGSPLFDVSVLDAVPGRPDAPAPEAASAPADGPALSVPRAPVPAPRTAAPRSGPARTGGPTASPTTRPTTRPTARPAVVQAGPVRPAPAGTWPVAGLLPGASSGRPRPGVPAPGYGRSGAGPATRAPSRQSAGAWGTSAAPRGRAAGGTAEPFRVPAQGYLAPQPGGRPPVQGRPPQTYRPAGSTGRGRSRASIVFWIVLFILFSVLRALN